MKITGIIAEYNPFHAGHLYQMKAAGAESLVIVMDGAFTQRGEPAIMDKFARARMALEAGADAVIELPQVYAVRPAQIFARGGIDILRAIGADRVCFGCETDDAELLKRTAAQLLDESAEMKARMKAALAGGMSYPRALGAALDNPYIEKPNFILGLEYTKRLIETGSEMEIVPVKRTDDYHTGGATAARELIRAGNWKKAAEGLPDSVRNICSGEIAAGGLNVPGRLDPLILHTIRNLDGKTEYPDDAEGLMERIIKLAASAPSVSALVESVKCKRYTRARICRLIANALLELPPVPAEIPYIRLLGARKTAGELLREMDRRSGGRLVSSAAALKNDRCFAAECRATDIWGLGSGNPAHCVSGREYTQKFISI